MSKPNSQMIDVITGVSSEISVDREGKGSITRNGLCVLLGISRSSFRVDREPKKLAESLATVGFSYGDIIQNKAIPDVAVQCIIEYYAFDARDKSLNALTLFRSFAAIGVRAWFQDVKGYTKVEVAGTESEQMRKAAKALIEMAAIMDYSEDKPGIVNINNHAIGSVGKCLPGLITLEDVLKGREFTLVQKQLIGRIAASNYRAMTGKAPVKMVRKYTKLDGTLGITRVSAYPEDCLPILENAIELGFGS